MCGVTHPGLALLLSSSAPFLPCPLSPPPPREHLETRGALGALERSQSCVLVLRCSAVAVLWQPALEEGGPRFKSDRDGLRLDLRTAHFAILSSFPWYLFSQSCFLVSNPFFNHHGNPALMSPLRSAKKLRLPVSPTPGTTSSARGVPSPAFSSFSHRPLPLEAHRHLYLL